MARVDIGEAIRAGATLRGSGSCSRTATAPMRARLELAKHQSVWPLWSRHPLPVCGATPVLTHVTVVPRATVRFAGWN